jgi:Protein of unknown function (DUF3604)
MRGLEHEAKLGVNPFKSGIIGSSDAHNALPFVEEDNFFGKFPGQEPSPDRWQQHSATGEGSGGEGSGGEGSGGEGSGGEARYTWRYLAAGYAAVRAAENTREAVFDAMMRRETYGTSGSRKPDKNGKLPPVGDTVDVARATFTNTIGSAELAAVWKDPDFQPRQRAFYYVRVIEIPTPRWTAYDQVRFGVKMNDDVPMKQQERAWTPPIWYLPT